MGVLITFPLFVDGILRGSIGSGKNGRDRVFLATSCGFRTEVLCWCKVLFWYGKEEKRSGGMVCKSALEGLSAIGGGARV